MLALEQRLSFPEQQELLVAKRQFCQLSMRKYIREAWPYLEPRRAFIPGWHIDAICDHLAAVKRLEIRNLLINIPPRHAKSSLVSVAYPSWVWASEPEHRFIYGSHSHNLAKRDSVKTRNVVQSPWYRDNFSRGWTMTEDQNEKSNFVNTAGGFRRATSVQGAIIGEGGDTLILDDPHSPRSVRSEVKRADELEWINEEFFTRINDPQTVSKIIIMQRLDERDASAQALAEGDWTHLMLPAEFESARRCRTWNGWEDPRKTEGEPLWKQRFDTQELEVLKKMGAKAWAGQGQQRPAPAEGNLIKRDWFQYYDALPEDIHFKALSVDLSFDDGDKASYAVFQLWGKRKGDRYLIKQVRRQMGFVEQLTVFRQMIASEEFISAKWVEKKANGAALIATVAREIPGVLPVEPRGSKEARLEAVSPQIASGNVFLPNPKVNPWVADYIEEMVTFPNALNDDQVDATSQALLKMGENIIDDWMPVSMKQVSKWTNF